MKQLTAPTGVSLKNILVATDFSASSVSALACVVPIAQASNSVVHILHVIRPAEIAIASPEASADMFEQRQLDAQRELGPLETVVGSVPHRMWVREGDVWTSIEDVIRSEHIDLIAVGASGKSDFKKFLVGSVAEEVVRKATLPVLSVGPHALRNSCGASPLPQLLYVTNLWEDSHDGLQYAIQMAIRYRSRLVLLHVVEQEEPEKSDHEWLSAYRRILRNLLPESASDLPVEPVLRIEVSKHPTGRILQVADEITASLVVMDVSPEETWATHLRDKVYEIVSWANCPVLTVRTKTLRNTLEGR
jgi:nucleotide-binding universal stress UspA family protein